MEAEFLHDDWVSRRHGVPVEGGRDIRSSYDESQALEILSIEPGWIHGERFYDVGVPMFEGNDRHCYFQDFGFGPYQKLKAEVIWFSIIEGEVETPKNTSDELALDFFVLRGERLELVKGGDLP